MRVKRIKSGNKGLEVAINRLVDAINANEPIEGSGIRLEKSSNGCVIRSAQSSVGGSNQAGGSNASNTQSSNSTSPDGSSASWQKIQVLDSSTQTVYDKWVWGGSNINPRPCSS